MLLRHAIPLGRLARTALPAGFLLGFLDFVWIKYLPFPLGELGNSSALWAVAAFLYAFWLRSRRWWGALGAAAGLVVAVPSYYLGLVVTNNFNREQVAASRAQQEANRRQLDIAMQGQITDRFAKAVDQLGQAGPDKLDVRLGAIYALERLMRDSVADHPAILEVLTAFVRVHAPVAGGPAPASATGAEAQPKPPIDVQTVLGRRNHNNDQFRRYIDLSETNLAGADMWSTTMADANLYGTNLSGANLDRGVLRGAVLTKANLRGAAVAALLEDAVLDGADLRGADLSSAVGLTKEQVRCTLVDDTTQLPGDIVRPAPNAPIEDPSCRRE